MEEKKSESKITKTKIDDEYNKFDVFGSIFTLPNKYEVLKPLGSGAYGGVVQAEYKKKIVAIK